MTFLNRKAPALPAQSRIRKVLWKWVAPLAAVAALALACFFYFYSPGQRSYRLTLTAGNRMGMRHQLAQRLQKEAARRGVTLELQPSKASEESLDWLNQRKVNVAMVQGGLTSAGRPNVRQVATLQIEPMHLAVKKELAPAAAASLLALRGKTVDLEEAGSGSYALALAILEFVGLKSRERDPLHGYILVSLDRQRLLTEQDTSRLPDAIFLVSPLPSSTTRYLVTRHGYRLVPVRHERRQFAGGGRGHSFSTFTLLVIAVPGSSTRQRVRSTDDHERVSAPAERLLVKITPIYSCVPPPSVSQ
jgi:TRAP-type uncharacterized transport system substrate-binding protein